MAQHLTGKCEVVSLISGTKQSKQNYKVCDSSHLTVCTTPYSNTGLLTWTGRPLGFLHNQLFSVNLWQAICYHCKLQHVRHHWLGSVPVPHGQLLFAQSKPFSFFCSWLRLWAPPRTPAPLSTPLPDIVLTFQVYTLYHVPFFSISAIM